MALQTGDPRLAYGSTSREVPRDVPRDTLTNRLSQTIETLQEALDCADRIANILGVGRAPESANKEPEPHGVIGAALTLSNRAIVLRAVLRDIEQPLGG